MPQAAFRQPSLKQSRLTLFPWSQPGQAAGAIQQPTDLPGLRLWLAADRLSGLVDSDPVGTWFDLSGQGNDATQGTAAAKPTYKTGILNGLPVVRFDGVDDTLNTPSLALDATLTGFVVLASTGALVRAVIWGKETGLIFWWSLGGTSGGTPMQVGNWDNPAMPPAGRAVQSFGVNPPNEGNPHILTLDANSVDVRMYKDGAQSGNAVVPNWTPYPRLYEVGIAAWSNTAYYLAGDYGDLLIYSPALSQSDRQRVERYLANKYGLTLA